MYFNLKHLVSGWKFNAINIIWSILGAVCCPFWSSQYRSTSSLYTYLFQFDFLIFLYYIPWFYWVATQVLSKSRGHEVDGTGWNLATDLHSRRGELVWLSRLLFQRTFWTWWSRRWWWSAATGDRCRGRGGGSPSGRVTSKSERKCLGITCYVQCLSDCLILLWRWQMLCVILTGRFTLDHSIMYLSRWLYTELFIKLTNGHTDQGLPNDTDTVPGNNPIGTV